MSSFLKKVGNLLEMSLSAFCRVKFTIHSATVEEATDPNGLSDPYVKLYIDDKVAFTTKVQKKTLSPVWEESFETDVLANKEVTFKVYDKDMLSDDYIGQCQVKLVKDYDIDPDEATSPVKSFQKMEVAFCRKDKPEKGKGKLIISIEFLSYTK